MNTCVSRCDNRLKGKQLFRFKYQQGGKIATMTNSIQPNKIEKMEFFFMEASVGCWWTLVLIQTFHVLYCIIVPDDSGTFELIFSHAIVSSPGLINIIFIVKYLLMAALFFAVGFAICKRQVKRYRILSVCGIFLHVLFDVILLGVPFSGYLTLGSALWMIILWIMVFATVQIWLYMMKNRKDLTCTYLLVVFFTFICTCLWLVDIGTDDLSETYSFMDRMSIYSFDFQHWFVSLAVLFSGLWLLSLSLLRDIDNAS